MINRLEKNNPSDMAVDHPLGLTLIELAIKKNASVRLKKALLAASKSHLLPFKTVGQYLAYGEKAESFLYRVPNIGRKTATELLKLALEYQSEVTSSVVPPIRVENNNKESLNLITWVKVCGGSVRLTNALGAALRAGALQYVTVGEYRDGGEEAEAWFSALPAVGLGTVSELREIVTKPFEKKAIDIDAHSLPLIDLVRKSGGSVRLRNALTVTYQTENAPYMSVGEYLEGGAQAETWFRKLPAVGNTTVKELREIVSSFVTKMQAAQEQSVGFGKVPGVKAAGYPELLSNLPPKELLVISERYGFNGLVPKTLGELGKQFSVTRERIRQLESRAIDILRTRFFDEITSYLTTRELNIWNAATDNTGFLRKRDELDARNKPLPEDALAIDVIHGSFTGWITQYAQPCSEGWLQREASVSAIESIRSNIPSIVGDNQVPIPIEKIIDRFSVSKESLQIALNMGGDFSEYLGYIVKSPLRSRKRRAVRLHHIMCSECSDSSISLLALKNKYYEAFLDDQCSTRDMQIVMVDAPHLFLNMYEEGWMAINKISCTSFVAFKDGTSLEPDIPDNVSSPREENSIAGILRQILRSNGPLSFDEIRQHFVAIVGSKYSKSSVGPILINTEGFLRFSPGVYGLREHLEQPKTMAKAMETLLGVKHLSIYCQACWAGEPYGLYPMWNVDMEHSWACWSRDTKQEDLLHSLLAIAELDSWNVTNMERERWERLKVRHALYLLEEENNTSIVETIPSLVEVVACSLQAKQREGISWVSANRVRGLRIDDKHSHTMLALLIALGVVEAAEHWQRWHPFSFHGNKTIEKLLTVLEANLESAWPKDALTIVAEAAVLERESGWLDPTELCQLLDTLSAKSDWQLRSPEDMGGAMANNFDLDTLIKLTMKNRAQRNSGLLN